MKLIVKIDAPDTPFVEYNGKPSDLRALVNMICKYSNVSVYSDESNGKQITVIIGDNR